jgi:predicted metal-binding membrane protein
LGRTADLRLTAVFLLAVAAICWLVTAGRMDGMDMGPGTDLGSFGWFAGIWAVMMAAMMLPSLVPMAGAYARQARGGSPAVTPRSVWRTTLFTAGYLAAWVIVGLVAWVVFDLVHSLDPSFLHWDDGGRYVAGAVIAGAAIYEFTPMKKHCLRHCRDRQLLVADWHEGADGALRMGLGQGAYCIGTSWALMAALFALGVMSITWMVVVAALIAFQKLWPSVRMAERITVVVLLALAIGVAFFPSRTPGLTVPTEAMGSMGSSGSMKSMDSSGSMDSSDSMGSEQSMPMK